MGVATAAALLLAAEALSLSGVPGSGWLSALFAGFAPVVPYLMDDERRAASPVSARTSPASSPRMAANSAAVTHAEQLARPRPGTGTTTVQAAFGPAPTPYRMTTTGTPSRSLGQ